MYPLVLSGKKPSTWLGASRTQQQNTHNHWVKLRFRGEYEDKSGEIYIVDIVTERLINIKMPCLLHSFHIIKKADGNKYNLSLAISPISSWRRGAGRNSCIAGYINPFFLWPGIRFFCGLHHRSSSNILVNKSNHLTPNSTGVATMH